MANKECVLFHSNAAWDLQSCPVPGIQKMAPMSNEPNKLSSLNTVGTTKLSAFISRAIWEIVKGNRSDICVIKVGNGTYASEWKQADGSYVVAYASMNGELNAALVPESGKRYSPVPELGNPSDKFDTSSILACYVLLYAELTSGTPAPGGIEKDLEEAKAYFKQHGELPEDELYRIGDAIQHALNNGVLPCKIPQGGIELLTKSRVTSGAFAGEILCGRSELLMPGYGLEGSLELVQLKDAMKRFAPYADQTNWGPEELARIPDLPEDMYVPVEALDMIQWYVDTKDTKLPAVNFMWRGITGSGKSTGVKLMAKILRKPLYIMTCYTNMETGDFLSTLVPASKPQVSLEELPCIDDIYMDPEYAYEKLTGEKVSGVSSQAALEKYAEVFAANMQQGSDSYFKRVEAEFVKGLRQGGIVEIQECSRIRDSGVLVGLNEYDHAGALIPLIDGGYATRSPGAITVWSDNIGYGSCRPVDPSVMRRMATVTDTFELSKATIVSRCLYNIDNALDKDTVGALYEVFSTVRSFCQQEEITEADVSPSDFENWVLHLSRCGMQDIFDSCRKCIVAKTTTDRDTQDRIQTAVAEPAIAKYLK